MRLAGVVLSAGLAWGQVGARWVPARTLVAPPAVLGEIEKWEGS